MTALSPSYWPPLASHHRPLAIVILSQAYWKIIPIRSHPEWVTWASLGHSGKEKFGQGMQGNQGSLSKAGQPWASDPVLVLDQARSLDLLGMTWGLLPRECPRQCQPAIECPICGIQSFNYAQHYNRRHGQRSGCIRQRLPPGWATEHGFLYCACGDLVITGAK